MFEQRWGPRAESLAAGLESLIDHPAVEQLDRDQMKWAWSVSEAGVDDFEEYERRAHWGNNAQYYVRDFLATSKSILRYAEEGNSVDPADLAWATQASADVDALLPRFPTEQIDEYRRLGKSVVVCVSHLGAHRFLELMGERQQMDFYKIGTGKGGYRAKGTFNPTEDIGRQIAGLAQLARKEPQLIALAPDGHHGDIHRQFPFLGRQVSIAQGAASLACLIRGLTVYFGVYWAGKNVELVFKRGPSYEKGDNREDFFARWNDFYLGCLKEVVLGPPENLRFSGGIWRDIRV